KFGVWRLWEELSTQYPGVAFPHGYGLGVLAVGQDVVPAFRDFIEAAGRDPLVARFFAALGERITAPAQERRARAAAEEQLRVVDEARAAAEREANQALVAGAEARAELADVRAEHERLRAEHQQLRVERDRLGLELDRLALERDRLEVQLHAREA